MRGPWAEQREGPIKLEGETSEIFQIYVYWLYKHTIAFSVSKDVCKLLTEEMRNSLDLPDNEPSVEEGSQI